MLTVSIAFLIKLIGWKSLFAGMAVFAIALPLNIYTSKRYSDAQGDLMKVRDQKMVVVTEARKSSFLSNTFLIRIAL